MVDTWMSAGEQLLRDLVGNPDGNVMFGVLLGIALLAVFVGMWLMEVAFGLSVASGWRRLLGMLLALVGGLLSATAAVLYLCPFFHQELWQSVVVIAAAVIGVMVVGVLLYKLLLHTSYVKALACILGGVFLATIAVPLVISAMGSVKSGAKSLRKASTRSREQAAQLAP